MSNLLKVGDADSYSEGSSDIHEQETQLFRTNANDMLRLTMKKYAALLLWVLTLGPIVLGAAGARLPEVFGLRLQVWARFGLLVIFLQAGLRLVLYGVLRWMRKKDADLVASGAAESSNGSLASYLEAVAGPLTGLLTTLAFAAVWLSIYPAGCAPGDGLRPPLGSAPLVSSAIPVADEATAAAALALGALAQPPSSRLSVFLASVFSGFCVYEVMADALVCLVVVNLLLILETVVMKLGLWRFLRSNFQERILESRYRTYVVETIRQRCATTGGIPPIPVPGGYAGPAAPAPLAFPFVLPFRVPLFDQLLAGLNAGLAGAAPQPFDALVAGRPLSYREYRRRLNSWIQRQGLDEAVQQVALSIPQTDSAAKAVAKDLFARLCPPGQAYITLEDLAQVLPGRAPARDAYSNFDRDQDGTVTKTEFRHTCITIYRQMRNLAASVLDAGQAFRKLADTVHLLVVAAMLFVCMAIFGVQIHSIFAIVLSLLLGLNVVIGDVARRSFQGIVFLFVDHPYDIGDRVLVSSLGDGDPLTIHQINMLTTVFHRWNGQEVYVPNVVLSSATIYNISRSAEQWERIDFQLALEEEREGAAAGADKLGLFRDRLETFLKARAADFVAAYELKPVIAGELGKSEDFLDVLAMTLRVQCRPTLDSQKRWTRHSRLLSFVRSALVGSGLQLEGKLRSVTT